MAVGTGIGIDLSALDKAFKQADAHLTALTDKTKGLSKTTVDAFKQMAQGGVLPYVESLKQQKKYLEEIEASASKSRGMKALGKEAKKAVDEINKVIKALEKTDAYKNQKSGLSAKKFADNILGPGGDKSINNLREALRQLEAAQNRQNLNTTKGQVAYEQLSKKAQRVREEIDKATGSNKKLTEEAQKTQSAFEKLSGIITAAFAINTLRRFVNQMISVRGEFEMQHRSLQVLIGDIDQANLLWEKTVNLAVKSPFRVKDLVTYTKQLAAYRVESDKLYETNKMLADISAGLGVDMNRLILAFGQVKAANFLRGTELRQFSEAGVNMLEELAKRFTMLEGRAVSVGEVFERVSKRMVSFRDVEEVLKSITSEGGTFYQMQEKQSETLKGMIMNLKDSIDLAFNEMGESTESVTKKAVNAVRNLVDNWEKFRPVISGITVALVSTLVGVGVSKVISGFKLAGQALKELFTLIKTGSSAASLGAGPWVALFAIVTGVIVAITQAIGSMNKLQKELNKIYAEDTGNLDKSIARYQDLVNRLREANQGSQERRDIVEKLNNEYGKYLDFIVTEQTEIEQLVDSYDVLVSRMKEKAAAATYEKAFAEISDKYSKKIQDAREDLEKALEINKVSIQGKDMFSGEKGMGKIIPTENEINDIYRIIEQRLQNINSEEAKRYKTLAGQQQLLNSIIAGYYGEEYMVSFAKSSDATDIIDVLLERKEKELEIEEQISIAYKDSLNSRKARLEYDKLELEYAQKQAEIRAMPDKSQFEVNKMLNKLKEEFELNKIEIKFKFGQIGDEERDRLRNNLLNWATDTTKDVNNEIRRQLGSFMKEEEWSSFLITQDQQAQGMSSIIKEITNGYETQVGVIKEQLSLKTAGRKIDEKGLEYAQKQAKAYEVVANILGIELKTQGRISEELRKQINDHMPEKQKISLEDSYKSVKEIQEETNKEYKAQVEVVTMLINQKRAGIDIDGSALEIAREDLEMLREKMKLLGMKVDKPMSETARNSINYLLPDEFKISDIDALGGITKVNQEAAKAFEDAKKELAALLKMQDQQVEGLEDEILLLESQLPYLQRKVKLTGTEIKDRLSEVQLLEINTQLSEEYQLDEINLYKDRSTIISEIQAKEKEVVDMIRATKDMRKEGLTIEDGYLEKLQEKYLAYKAILDLIDHSAEEPIDRQRMYDINARLDSDYWIDVIDSQKSEVTLLQEANTEKEKAIAYEAQLLAMQKQGVTVTDEQLALAKKDVEQWTLRWKLLGGTEKENATSSRQNSLYDERIKVIDDMNKKYRELAKTLPEVEAKQGAFNAYIDAFAEAYKDIKWIPSNVREMTPEQFAEQVLNFPNEDDLVAFLDKLAKEPMKAFEKIKVELAKGEYVLDMKVRVQKDADKRVIEQVEQMFDEYDLALEIKKLNIPSELAKDLFGVNTRSLEELKEAVTDAFMGVELYSERIKDAGKLMEDTFNGNVDLLNRKLIPAQELAEKGWENVGDGLATVFSSSYSVNDASGKMVDILVTPILPDGTILSEKELEDYIANKIEGAEDVLKADDKGIIIHAGVDMEEGLGEYLHSLQEVFYASDMLSEDQKAKYKDFLEKIDDMEDKAQVERLKTYLQYTRSAIGERAKIKVEEMNKLMEIEETFNKASAKAKTEEDKKRIEEQRKLAIAGVQKESSDKTHELDWDAFRSSETFVTMFQDLDAASDALLNHAIEKIKEFQDQWTDMPISDAKEMIDKLNELEMALLDTGKPFEDYRKANKEIENAMLARQIKPDAKSGKSQQALREDIGAENKEMEDKIANSERVVALLEIINNANAETKQQELEKLGINQSYVESLGLSADVLTNSAEANNEIIRDEKQKAKDAQKNIGLNQKVLNQLNKQKDRLNEQADAIGKAQQMANDLYEAFSELAEALGADSDSPAAIFADMGMNMLNTVLSTIQLHLQLEAAKISAQGLGLAMNAAMGVVGWIVMAVQLLAQVITAIVQANDKKIDAQVERLRAQVEELEKKYDKLSETIDEVYSTAELEEVSRKLDEIYYKEKRALEQAIAVRKADKNISDDEMDEIADMEEQLIELEEKHAETMKEIVSNATDGIFDSVKDAARDFTDAWYDAFVETGKGINGLEENFNEMFMNLAKQQASMQITQAFVDRWKRDLEKYVNEKDTDLTPEDAAAWANEVKATFPELSAALEAFLGTIHESVGGLQSGELSSLQKGIQGITEETAQIIEAYLNSIRGYVSEQVTHTRNIYNILKQATTSDAAAIRVRMVE